MINLLRTKIKSIQTNLKDFINGKPFNREEKLREFGFIIDGPTEVIINEDSLSIPNPSCPDCKSHDVVKDGKNPKKIPGTKKSINKQRYKCNNCGRKFTINLKHTKKGDHHFTAIKVFAAFIRCASTKTSTSLREVKNLLMNFFNYSFSHESVRNSVSILIPKIQENISEIVGSGYYSYDEQWVRINGKWKFRQTLVDYQQNLILNEKVVDTIDEQTVSEFLIDTLNQSPITAITTDGDNSYPEAIKELAKIKETAIKHQRCTFHSQKQLTKIINTFKKSARKKYKKLKSQIRLIFSLDNPKTMKICFQDIGTDIEAFVTSLLEKEEKIIVARKIFDSIYILRNNYPKDIVKYIEDVNKNWENLTYFYSNPKISKTSNPNENMYSYSSGTKRRFKTMKGLEEHFLCKAFFRNNFKDGLSFDMATGCDFLLSMF